ncbi:MAG: hypothetical protein M1457_08285 [bacterium]|nr:hypothetical protein [bacterium]
MSMTAATGAPARIGTDAIANSRDAVAIMNGANVAALGLAISLRRVGWRGRVLCLDDQRQPWIAAAFPGYCEMLPAPLVSADQLPAFVNSRVDPAAPKVFLFVSEVFYDLFARPEIHELLPNTRFLLGPGLDLDLVLDRRRFYQFVAGRGLGEAPALLDSSEDPWATFPQGVRLVPTRKNGIRRLGLRRTAQHRPGRQCFRQRLARSPVAFLPDDPQGFPDR